MQFLPPLSANCPDVPADGACDVTENAICVWQDKTRDKLTGELNAGFTALGCYAWITGKEWYGVVGAGTTGGVNADQCPHQPPDTGSSCAGHEGQICYYPLGSSSCAVSGGNWAFSASAKVDSPPREIERLCPPVGIDETKQVKDLSDAEVDAWCNWYGDPSGTPRPAVSPNDRPGFANDYVSIYLSMASSVGVCIDELPAALCAKNLRTQPCTATLAQLDDCIETARAGFAPGWVGHGCAPLIANPTCPGVIAQKLPQGYPGCSVPTGGACAWRLANGTQQSQLGVTFTTKDGNSQPYLLQSGDAVSVIFDDTSQALFDAWNANAHPGCTLSSADGKTTVTLLAGFGQATVQGASLAANATLNATATVAPVSGTAVNLGIETFFGDGIGATVPITPFTCQGTAQSGPPR
jgi:hypothetical protein